MKKFFFIICVISIFVLTSCDSASQGPSSTGDAITKPISYGNGVYYFSCTAKDFGVSLSAFLKDGKEVKTITGNGTGAYGKDVGYFVIVAKK